MIRLNISHERTSVTQSRNESTIGITLELYHSYAIKVISTLYVIKMNNIFTGYIATYM